MVALRCTAGELTEVQRSATIDAADLQKFFYDLPITTKVTRGEGWVELAIYPGTSNRATRQDREDYEKRLNAGAGAARRPVRRAGIDGQLHPPLAARHLRG